MIERHKLVALLPMKANSERVPSKNFRPLAGRPLFRWILDTLLSVSEISKVVINTDAREILELHGLRNGDAGGRIVIRDRRPEICGDHVSMNLVLADDVENVPSDTYLMTHTTNPLLSADAIRGALEAYRLATMSGEADSLFTVNRIQTRFYRGDRSPVNHDPDRLVRTQDLEPWFEENSNLYVFSQSSFASTQARIGRRPLMFQSPPLESIDIDTADQWTLVEALATFQRSRGNT